MMRDFCGSGEYIRECYVDVIRDPEWSEDSSNPRIFPAEK